MNHFSLLSVLLMLSLSCYLPAQEGFLDVSFGNSGMVTTDINNLNDVANDIIVQPDGKILVAGYTSNNIKDFFCLIRYNEDGSLDEEFGDSGIVITEFASTSVGATVKLQADGKIIIGGHTWAGEANVFAMVRYQSDGTVDTGFGESGKVMTAFSDENGIGRSLAIQTDGKIILGGRRYTIFNDADDFALARYYSDGTLDQSFGEAGLVVTSITEFTMDWLNDLMIQADGKIVAAGFSGSSFALVKYEEDGSLDISFGDNGIVITNFSGAEHGVLSSIQIMGDGSILGAGFIRDAFSDFALIKYRSNGDLDTSFGEEGIVITALSTESDGVEAVELQFDGKIVVAGSALVEGRYQFKIARYNSLGDLDSSFGENGVSKNTLDFPDSQLTGMTLHESGKILVCGFTSEFPYDFVVAQYLAQTVNATDISGFSGLTSVYPNPSELFVTLEYELDQADEVSIQLLDTKGSFIRQVATMERANKGLNRKQVLLNDLPSGTYIIAIDVIGKGLKLNQIVKF